MERDACLIDLEQEPKPHCQVAGREEVLPSCNTHTHTHTHTHTRTHTLLDLFKSSHSEFRSFWPAHIPRTMKLPVVRYSPDGAVFDTFRKGETVSPLRAYVSLCVCVWCVYLVMVDPPCAGDNASLPGRAVTDGHCPSLIQCAWWHKSPCTHTEKIHFHTHTPQHSKN